MRSKKALPVNTLEEIRKVWEEEILGAANERTRKELFYFLRDLIHLIANSTPRVNRENLRILRSVIRGMELAAIDSELDEFNNEMLTIHPLLEIPRA